MAFISFNNLWESEFVNIVSKRNKVQALNNIQLKLQVHDIQKKKLKNQQQNLNLLVIQMI